LQELVWLIQNNFDFDAAQKSDTLNRIQWIE
jgi:hypothetical protein